MSNAARCNTDSSRNAAENFMREFSRFRLNFIGQGLIVLGAEFLQ